MLPGKIEVYKAEDGWRWRLLSPNGRIVAVGGEAYERRLTMLKTINKYIVRDSEPLPLPSSLWDCFKKLFRFNK